MQQDCLSADFSSAYPENPGGPTRLGLQKVSVLVSLQGKSPATGDPVSDLGLACTDQVEHFIVKPAKCLASRNCF